MPELPDVEIFKQYLDATSLHRTIDRVDIKTPGMLKGISAKKLQQRLQQHSRANRADARNHDEVVEKWSDQGRRRDEGGVLG